MREGGEHARHLLGPVLVRGVAAARQQLQLEAALHLAHGEVAVEPVQRRQQQQARRRRRQEGGRQPAEPARPVRLRAGQRHAPAVPAERHVLPVQRHFLMGSLSSLCRLGRGSRMEGLGLEWIED